MKVGLIQQANVEDIKTNMTNLALKIREAKNKGAELVVLQELHNSLYFCNKECVDNFDLAESIPGESTEYYSKLSKELNIVLVLSLFEKRSRGIFHNTSVVIEKDGTVSGKYRKMHIPDDPCYYEKFYFTPGDLGFEPIDTSLGRLGVLVCWDQWYPEAARIMAMKGADILIYPTAIGEDANDTEDERKRQRDAWQLVQRGHAVANGLHVVTVNRVGIERDHSCNSEILFWGKSFVSGPQGEIILEMDDKEGVQVVEIDLDKTDRVRKWWPFFRDRRIEYFDVLSKRFLD